VLLFTSVVFLGLGVQRSRLEYDFFYSFHVILIIWIQIYQSYAFHVT
jgi:hypothetical protein